MGFEEIECVGNLEWWVWKDFEEYVLCDDECCCFL